MDDIFYLSGMVANGNIGNYTDFFFGVVTSQGGNYGLIVEDPVKASTFFNNNNAGIQKDITNDTYVLMYVNDTKSKSDNEKGLIHFLNHFSTSLKLIEATDNTFSNWKELQVNNGVIVKVNCN